MAPVEIKPGLRIEDEELRWTFSRSGGPGGQNVNKVATRVTLYFDLRGSTGLPPEVKSRLLARLAGRLSKDGGLAVTVQDTRSQARNRRIAEQRLGDIIRRALEPTKKRRPTRVPRAQRRRRLEAKKRRSGTKALRRKVGPQAD